MLHVTRKTDIRRLAAARAISFAGAEAAYIAIVSTVYDRTGSGAWVAAVLAAWIGVGGLVAPLAGALGDRFDRRRVMIASDLAGAVAFAALAFAHSPEALLVLAAVAAVCEAPFFPAASAAIPNLATDDDLPWANGLITAGRTFGGLVGPVAGGLLYGTVGPGVAFAVNAASFVLSAALIVSVRGPFSTPRPGAGRGGLTAGFRFVARTPLLRALAIAWAIFLVGIGLMLVAELPLARVLDAGSLGYGILVAGWAAGGLAGSLLARRIIASRGELPALVAGAGGAAVAFGLTGVAPVLATACATMALAGLLNSISAVAEETVVQRATPDDVRSRVMAAQEAIWIGSLGLGLGAGGFLLEAVGARSAYVVAGGIGLAAAVLLAWLLRGRKAATG